MVTLLLNSTQQILGLAEIGKCRHQFLSWDCADEDEYFVHWHCQRVRRRASYQKHYIIDSGFQGQPSAPATGSWRKLAALPVPSVIRAAGASQRRPLAHRPHTDATLWRGTAVVPFPWPAAPGHRQHITHKMGHKWPNKRI